ncbi:phosphatidylethanolamine N-methyltransferase [Acrasis kona]|uniref:Phosphatidylethanolamine N-methyltransferase n=1 Tax=Acrasis kona TaxID=1008807 RepID=A0AAW2ZIC6_9EUKA
MIQRVKVNQLSRLYRQFSQGINHLKTADVQESDQHVEDVLGLDKKEQNLKAESKDLPPNIPKRDNAPGPEAAFRHQKIPSHNRQTN